jgi:hypothetical protein
MRFSIITLVLVLLFIILGSYTWYVDGDEMKTLCLQTTEQFYAGGHGGGGHGGGGGGGRGGAGGSGGMRGGAMGGPRGGGMRSGGMSGPRGGGMRGGAIRGGSRPYHSGGGRPYHGGGGRPYHGGGRRHYYGGGGSAWGPGTTYPRWYWYAPWTWYNYPTYDYSDVYVEDDYPWWWSWRRWVPWYY